MLRGSGTSILEKINKEIKFLEADPRGIQETLKRVRVNEGLRA